MYVIPLQIDISLHIHIHTYIRYPFARTQIESPVRFTLPQARRAVVKSAAYASKFISEHRTCMCVCVCMCGVAVVHAAFSISHTNVEGGHPPPEAKRRFGRTSDSPLCIIGILQLLAEMCLPSTCLVFRPAKYCRLCSVASTHLGVHKFTDRESYW